MSETSISTVEDLIAVAELTDVLPFEIHAERKVPPDPKPRGKRVHHSSEMNATASRRDGKLLLRLKMPVETWDAKLVAAVGVTYEVPEDLEIPDDVLGEFIARLGVMTAYPFLREAIYSAATKIRVTPPVLGLMRPLTRDDFKVTDQSVE
ncbi:hypothetical protein ACIBL3_04685 [Kribbella sp. NPDC050124]|uniref:hypothetical protein n=1 Tax=Kribbella sp. NPDC050124 TaxID=3364114 RepID=UPI0037AFAEAB